MTYGALNRIQPSETLLYCLDYLCLCRMRLEYPPNIGAVRAYALWSLARLDIRPKIRHQPLAQGATAHLPMLHKGGVTQLHSPALFIG